MQDRAGATGYQDELGIFEASENITRDNYRAWDIE